MSRIVQVSGNGTVLLDHCIYSEQFTPTSILYSEVISLMVLTRAGADFISAMYRMVGYMATR
jgi:hypothetical protein